MSNRNDKQTCECGSDSKMMVSVPEFVLKGDGWTGKNIKVKGQMETKNHRLSEKSRDLPTQRLVPNVGGEEVDSWSEAKKLASSMGKDTSGYDAVIRKEKLA